MTPPIIDRLHLYPKDNATRHFTNKFDLVQSDVPIIRRGQKFHAVLMLQGEYNPVTDPLRITFSFGEHPNGLKGTRAVIRIFGGPKAYASVKKNPRVWDGRVIRLTADAVTLEMCAPVECPVGAWRVTIEPEVPEPNIWEFPDDVYILFNPWCKGDQVYMENTKLLEEYVQNDSGKIWVGPIGSSKGREWLFGQFDECVLPAISLMMDRSGLPAAQRGDPVLVCRAISRIVNSNDDRGVLVGRWDGEYGDGTAPAAWTGSVGILDLFLETEEEVSYGQCWVFAGVVTTVCRALGIPSRVVTNLVSAHDANCSLTVDRYYDANNVELDFDPNNPTGEDSVWNYHVWNDVWMARPDLPKGYGGWQAIDATPQELSGGFMQCGPAPLEAIKQGQVGYRYDVPFLLASVNADLMRWKEDPTTTLGYRPMDCNKYHIGRMILTKMPMEFDPYGDNDREEITDQYKSTEGTNEERLTLNRAVRNTEQAKRFHEGDTKADDMEFELEDLDRVNIGEPFSVTVNIKNNSNEVRNVSAVLSAGSVYYTGVKAHIVKKSQGDFAVQPNSSEQLRMQVTPDEYMSKLVEYCVMKLYSIATVHETKQTWADEDDFQVLKPSIDIKLPSVVTVGQPCPLTLSFVNPLRKVLTKCSFQIAGPGLVFRTLKVVHQDVRPGEPLRVMVELQPKTAGEVKLVTTFCSNELVDVTGVARVIVRAGDASGLAAPVAALDVNALAE